MLQEWAETLTTQKATWILAMCYPIWCQWFISEAQKPFLSCSTHPVAYRHHDFISYMRSYNRIFMGGIINLNVLWTPTLKMSRSGCVVLNESGSQLCWLHQQTGLRPWDPTCPPLWDRLQKSFKTYGMKVALNLTYIYAFHPSHAAYMFERRQEVVDVVDRLVVWWALQWFWNTLGVWFSSADLS